MLASRLETREKEREHAGGPPKTNPRVKKRRTKKTLTSIEKETQNANRKNKKRRNSLKTRGNPQQNNKGSWDVFSCRAVAIAEHEP
jgi:hypothetical protein